MTDLPMQPSRVFAHFVQRDTDSNRREEPTSGEHEISIRRQPPSNQPTKMQHLCRVVKGKSWVALRRFFSPNFCSSALATMAAGMKGKLTITSKICVLAICNRWRVTDFGFSQSTRYRTVAMGVCCSLDLRDQHFDGPLALILSKIVPFCDLTNSFRVSSFRARISRTPTSSVGSWSLRGCCWLVCGSRAAEADAIWNCALVFRFCDSSSYPRCSMH
jgi:hypothetical protein